MNRGKPLDRFSPDGKTQYAIGNYVSTHRLSPQNQEFVNQMAGIKIPNKVKNAFKDAKWIEAVNVEMEALQKNGTWEIVPLPEGKKNPTGVDGCIQSSTKLMG